MLQGFSKIIRLNNYVKGGGEFMELLTLLAAKEDTWKEQVMPILSTSG
jgi:hypothetical protein